MNNYDGLQSLQSLVNAKRMRGMQHQDSYSQSQPVGISFDGIPEKFARGIYQGPGDVASVFDMVAPYTTIGAAVNHFAPTNTTLESMANSAMGLAEVEGAYNALRPARGYGSDNTIQGAAVEFVAPMVSDPFLLGGAAVEMAPRTIRAFSGVNGLDTMMARGAPWKGQGAPGYTPTPPPAGPTKEAINAARAMKVEMMFDPKGIDYDMIDRMTGVRLDRRAMPRDAANTIGGNQRGAIGSTGAKAADLDALAKAYEMQKGGAGADDIYSKTRWWLDHPDGRPRFEIDDSGSVMDYAALNSQQKIDDLLTHPDLYQQYPDTRNIDLVGMGENTTRGNYHESGDMIGVGAGDSSLMSMWKDGKYGGQHGATLHELQHAIQGRENMARGGSPDNAALLGLNKDDQFRMAQDAYEEAKGINGSMSTDQLLAELTDQPYKQTTAVPWNELPQRQQIEWLARGRERAYRRLAGEAEARLVQDRMNMTMDERLADPFYQNFDVPLEDQIVRMDGGIAQQADSLPMDEASRMARAEEMGFDTGTTYYHGTRAHKGASALEEGFDIPGEGAFFTEDKELARSYSPYKGSRIDENVLDAKLKMEKPFSPDNPKDIGAEWVDDWIDFWREEGGWIDRYTGEEMSNYDVKSMIENTELYNYDGSGTGERWKDFLGTLRDHHDGFVGIDPTDTSARIAVVFEPNQIRSTKAKFDPANRNSANILAGAAPVAVGTGGLLEPRDEYVTK